MCIFQCNGRENKGRKKPTATPKSKTTTATANESDKRKMRWNASHIHTRCVVYKFNVQIRNKREVSLNVYELSKVYVSTIFLFRTEENRWLEHICFYTVDDFRYLKPLFVAVTAAASVVGTFHFIRSFDYTVCMYLCFVSLSLMIFLIHVFIFFQSHSRRLSRCLLIYLKCELCNIQTEVFRMK